MKFNVKSVLKKVGIFSVVMSMWVTSVGITSLASHTTNDELMLNNEESLNEMFSSERNSHQEFSEIDYLTIAEEIKAEKDAYVKSLYDGIASSSNATNVIAVVTTAEELEEAIAIAEDGDVVEIANDIYLNKTIEINSNIIFKAISNAEAVSIYSGQDIRHFSIYGNEIMVMSENVIIDGENNGGGIISYADNLILSNVNILNCSNWYGGAVYALGELIIIESEFMENTAFDGGALYAKAELTIIESKLFQNNATQNGGAICANTNLIIKKCYINDNKATGGGGGIIIYQDAVVAAVVVVMDSTFLNNISSTSGGGMCFVDFHETSINPYVIISGCEFTGNSSYESVGGGLGLSGKTISYIIDSKFTENFSNGGGGGIYISNWCFITYISNCDISNNYTDIEWALGGGIEIGFNNESVAFIEDSKICSNFSSGKGGGIGVSNSPETSLFEDLLIISNCEITNNVSNSSSYGSGGGIFVYDGAYKWLKICNNSIIKNNFAMEAYQIGNIDDIAVHNQQIDSTTTWTDGFDYIYNNLDISYWTGTIIPTHVVNIMEVFEDYNTTNVFRAIANKSFHYDFNAPKGYKAIIESNIDLDINMENGTIDIDLISRDIDIQITYVPVEESDNHTVILITHYTDGVKADESKSYQVQNGTSFLESYEALEGYTFAGMSIRMSYPEINVNAQTVYIDSVTEDYTITIKLTRKSQTVQITTQYMDGILPDETKSYQVLYGDAFAESYDALEGYVFAGMSVRSYPYVDISAGMVCIDEVTEDYHIIVKLRRAEYKVTITVEYENGTIDNQVSTYTVLHGEVFSEHFEIANGYNIAIIKAEKGIDLDYFMQLVEIENVTKDMNVMIVCR